MQRFCRSARCILSIPAATVPSLLAHKVEVDPNLNTLTNNEFGNHSTPTFSQKIIRNLAGNPQSHFHGACNTGEWPWVQSKWAEETELMVSFPYLDDPNAESEWYESWPTEPSGNQPNLWYYFLIWNIQVPNPSDMTNRTIWKSVVTAINWFNPFFFIFQWSDGPKYYSNRNIPELACYSIRL